MEAITLIEQQQTGKEDTTVWMVGEQLKDICREDPACAELVARDLLNPDMSIDCCERKIKAWADGVHKKTNKNVGVPPSVAESIIREFYGLPGRPEAEPQKPAPAPQVLNIADFF